MTRREAVLNLMDGPAEFEVALLVRDECVRQGRTAMLGALVMVRDVTIWDDIDVDLDFDILVLRFGVVSAAAAGRLAQDAWLRGKKILLLLNRVQDDMLDAIAAIPSNGFLVQDERTSASAHLTPRERQVLDLLVEGFSDKQIAHRLRISQHGVKRLVSNVLAKLNCPNRTQAVAVALTAGIAVRESGHSACPARR
jgi:DNA-binding CsgD family transcriptional regulator